MNNNIKKDALTVPLTDEEELIITSDNSGSIGMKQYDDVAAPYNIVGYFTFRVAYMDCIASGGMPIAVSLMNFNGDDAWDPLLQGINQGIAELEIRPLPVTGSTESNFSLKQSATSLTVIGKRNVRQHHNNPIDIEGCRVAIIGKPLVGEEVLTSIEQIVPLSLFQWFSKREEVFTILPVGSKGIAYELTKIWPTRTFSSEVDIEKSSGPATCFIVIYDKNFHDIAKNESGEYYHPITSS